VILVTGATGNAGGAVLRAALAAGAPARALARDAGAALPDGAEAVVGDLNEPDSLVAALAGVSGIFLLSGYRELERTLELARTAGVEHVVLLSSSAAPGGDLDNAVARYHILSERRRPPPVRRRPYRRDRPRRPRRSRRRRADDAEALRPGVPPERAGVAAARGAGRDPRPSPRPRAPV
jgi:nucleoside-diphosphate-sugar epimerase